MTTGAAGVESDSNDRSYKYQAFISYKRNVDHEIAASLLEALETYAVPARIQRDYNVGKRCGRLFKDDDELSAASNLPEALRIALDESKYLIVLCSPAARAAPWIDLEIRHFLSLGRADRVLAALVDGEPSTAFPPSLVSLNPLAVDLRGKTHRERKRRLASEKLRLLARIIGCEYDALRQRDSQRALSRLRWGLVGVAFVAVAALAMLVYIFGLRQTSEARRISAEARLATATRAMDQLSGLIENQLDGDANLDDVKAELTRLIVETQRALASTTAPGRDDRLIQISTHLYRAEIAEGHADLAGAAREYWAALAVGQGALLVRPSDVPLRQDVAMLHHRLFGVLTKLGDRAQADKQLALAIAQNEALFREVPSNVVIRANLCLAYLSLGKEQQAAGDPRAEATFASIIELADIQTPSHRYIDIDVPLAEAHRRLGELHLEKGNIEEAIEQFRAVVAVSEPALVNFPKKFAPRELATDYLQLASALERANKLGDAARSVEKALVFVDRFVADHPQSFVALYDRWQLRAALLTFAARGAGGESIGAQLQRFLESDQAIEKELLSSSERITGYVEESLRIATLLFEHGASSEATTIARRTLSVLVRAAREERGFSLGFQQLVAAMPRLIALLGPDEPVAFAHRDAKQCRPAFASIEDPQLLRCGYGAVVLASAAMLRQQDPGKWIDLAMQLANALHDKRSANVLRFQLQVAHLALGVLIPKQAREAARRISQLAIQLGRDLQTAEPRTAEEKRADAVLNAQTLLLSTPLHEGDGDMRRRQLLEVITTMTGEPSVSGQLTLVSARLGLADEWLRVNEHGRAREQLREIRALLAGQQRTRADVRIAAWLSAEWMLHLFEGKLAVAKHDRPACTASIQRLSHLAGAINARGQAALAELRAACDAL